MANRPGRDTRASFRLRLVTSEAEAEASSLLVSYSPLAPYFANLAAARPLVHLQPTFGNYKPQALCLHALVHRLLALWRKHNTAF